MKTLYMMRHGQTIFNVSGKIQGWCDSPLTNLGRQEAEEAGKWFREWNIAFDNAYSSTSERTFDTLEIVTGGLMDIVRVRGLKSWYFGKLEGNDVSLLPAFPYGSFPVQFHGEDQHEFVERIVKTVKGLMDMAHDYAVVLMVVDQEVSDLFYARYSQFSKVENGLRPGDCLIFRYAFDGITFYCEQVDALDFSHLRQEESQAVYITEEEGEV